MKMILFLCLFSQKTGQMPIHKAAAIHPFGYRTGALEFLISKGAQLDAKDKVHTVMTICILQ